MAHAYEVQFKESVCVKEYVCVCVYVVSMLTGGSRQITKPYSYFRWAAKAHLLNV